jgi:hypothetical protein
MTLLRSDPSGAPAPAAGAFPIPVPLTRDAIVVALRDPAATVGWSAAQWDLLVRQGRRAHLLARLGLRLEAAGLLESVPHAARMHLRSAILLVERQNQALAWELERIAEALDAYRLPVLLLKGAAYAVAGLPVAAGRNFSDVDILVPRERIGAAEEALMLRGWQSAMPDAYDQQYYRRWMHELPPMRHVKRGTTLDVHHAILPPTARTRTDSAPLLADAVALPGMPGLRVLQPVDMLLHSATHLFHEGELDKGLRDLHDLDSLLRHFGTAEPGFWEALVPRATRLGLARPLYYALRFTRELLATPVPEAVFAQAVAAGRPSAPVDALMGACYHRALRPMHASATTRGSRPARFALYLRAHWMRMPLPMLAAHLARKALRRGDGERDFKKSLEEANGDRG